MEDGRSAAHARCPSSWLRALALVSAVSCGGQSTGTSVAGGGGDSARDASGNAGAGGAASGGVGGSFASGGASGAGRGGLSFDLDAATRAIEGISGPSGACELTGMTCEGGSALCLCAPGRTWDCGPSPDASSIVLPARAPLDAAECSFEGFTCKGWTACSPTCTCSGGKWSCTPREGCVVPSCDGQTLQDGGLCSTPGLSCGGGCRSCVCEPTGTGVSRWACVALPC